MWTCPSTRVAESGRMLKPEGIRADCVSNAMCGDAAPPGTTVENVMLVSSIIPGNPVYVACDLTAPQIAACGHALRFEREGRFRNAEMSTDDTLALRELTAIIDLFEILASHGAHDTVTLTAARLTQLSDAVRTFVVTQSDADAVSSDSRLHLPAAAGLVDALSDLAHEALQAALGDMPEIEIDDSMFDELLGG
jgi:hypothetical protein